MTSARKRKLLKMQQQQNQQPKAVELSNVEQLESWPEPVYSRYFMAELLEDEENPKDPPAWNLYRLADFCVPGVMPNPVFAVEEDELDKLKVLMARLDELQPQLIKGLNEESSKHADSAVAS